VIPLREEATYVGCEGAHVTSTVPPSAAVIAPAWIAAVQSVESSV
jgi:hypothetical protein